MPGQRAGKGNASPPAALKKAIERPRETSRTSTSSLRLSITPRRKGASDWQDNNMHVSSSRSARPSLPIDGERRRGRSVRVRLLGGQPVETRLVATPSYGRRRLLLTFTSPRPAPPPRSLERGQFARVLTSRRVGGHDLAARIPSFMQLEDGPSLRRQIDRQPPP